jgi:hypothetical protein
MAANSFLAERWTAGSRLVAQNGSQCSQRGGCLTNAHNELAHANL